MKNTIFRGIAATAGTVAELSAAGIIESDARGAASDEIMVVCEDGDTFVITAREYEVLVDTDAKLPAINKGTTLLYYPGQSAWFVVGFWAGEIVLAPVENNRSDVLVMSPSELKSMLLDGTWKVLK